MVKEGASACILSATTVTVCGAELTGAVFME